MRNVKTIEAQIVKLQAELADVKEEESMRSSAVHVLKNLGWTRRNGKWCAPQFKEKKWNPDLDVGHRILVEHIKVGDFVQSALTSDILYVRKVNTPSDIECSRVIRIQPHGTAVASAIVHRSAGNLKVIDPMDHMGYGQL